MQLMILNVFSDYVFLLVNVIYSFVCVFGGGCKPTKHNEMGLGFFSPVLFAYWQKQTKHYQTSVVCILMMPSDTLPYISMQVFT